MSNRMTLAAIRKKALDMPLEQAVKWLSGITPEYGVSVARLADIYIRKLNKQNVEKERLRNLFRYEKAARKEGFIRIGGIDEAGRGPLAGPVVAACVILPENCFIEQLNDSKKLSSEVRDKLFDLIKSEAVDFGIGMVMADEIDEINILNATKKAMTIAVSKLKHSPDYLIIDAVELPVETEQLTLPKADSLSASVAAASILAKVTRDRWMEESHKKYPQYGFNQHKGYGTRMHIEAIRKYGACPTHRKSFIKRL
ncbi:MAG: ribonuclease HII [Clostridiaceae bacterium]|nr:ribonuclease HII [Clostridiaceae bacterium]